MVDRKEKKRQENGWKTDASGRKWGGGCPFFLPGLPSCSASGIGAVTVNDRIDQGSRIPSLALGLMADTDDSPSRAAVQAAARWLTKVCVCMWWVACIAGHLHQTGYETVRGGVVVENYCPKHFVTAHGRQRGTANKQRRARVHTASSACGCKESSSTIAWNQSLVCLRHGTAYGYGFRSDLLSSTHDGRKRRNRSIDWCASVVCPKRSKREDGAVRWYTTTAILTSGISFSLKL